ncbi:2778_t:CDS:2 [Racocetra persica]|uniref:2778_t:CDS:1 n=1 Tax=Racocetra persica TaxID=160502 RepID=A0ACA9LRB2_9GLOM|nr:2778_t:CDS:2 [Racocetra persica]
MVAASASRGFMRNWYRLEILPIYVVTGFAVVGGSWYLTRLARGPDVVWDKNTSKTYVSKSEVRQDKQKKPMDAYSLKQIANSVVYIFFSTHFLIITRTQIPFVHIDMFEIDFKLRIGTK